MSLMEVAKWFGGYVQKATNGRAELPIEQLSLQDIKAFVQCVSIASKRIKQSRMFVMLQR